LNAAFFYCFVCLHVMGLSRFGSSKGESQGGSCTSALRPMRKHITDSVATCIQVLDWMDRHEDCLPIYFKKCPPVAQRVEYLLCNKFRVLTKKKDHPLEVRALLDQISQQRTRSAAINSPGAVATLRFPRRSMRNPIFSAFQTCNQVLQWMNAHEDELPLKVTTPTSDAQRAENHLRLRFNRVNCKTVQSLEVRALLGKIVQQRRLRAPGDVMSSRPSSSVTKCMEVLAWMEVHEGRLPVLVKNHSTDAQRSEHLLRRQFNVYRKKTIMASSLRFFLDKIERRMSFVSGITTCKKVLVWMYGHAMGLPKEVRKPNTDIQRSERRLRIQLKYLTRKTDQPPEVLALLDYISRQRTRPAPRPSTRNSLFFVYYELQESIGMDGFP
jgi:hypothetical protein